MATRAEIAAATDTLAIARAGFNSVTATVTAASTALEASVAPELVALRAQFRKLLLCLSVVRPVLVQAVADVTALSPSDPDVPQMLGPSGLSSGAFDSKMRYGATG